MTVGSAIVYHGQCDNQGRQNQIAFWVAIDGNGRKDKGAIRYISGC